MAETIEYNSLVKFIKDEIIEERLTYALRMKKLGMIGGAAPSNTGLYSKVASFRTREDFAESLKNTEGLKNAKHVWNYRSATGKVQTNETNADFIKEVDQWVSEGGFDKITGNTSVLINKDDNITLKDVTDQYPDLFRYFKTITEWEDLGKKGGYKNKMTKKEASVYISNVQTLVFRDYMDKKLKTELIGSNLNDIFTNPSDMFQSKLHDCFLTCIQKYMKIDNIEDIKTLLNGVNSGTLKKRLEEKLKENDTQLLQKKQEDWSKSNKFVQFYKFIGSGFGGETVADQIKKIAKEVSEIKEVEININDYYLLPEINNINSNPTKSNDDVTTNYNIAEIKYLLVLFFGLVMYICFINRDKILKNSSFITKLVSSVIAIMVSFGVVSNFGVVIEAYNLLVGNKTLIGGSGSQIMGALSNTLSNAVTSVAGFLTTIGSFATGNVNYQQIVGGIISLVTLVGGAAGIYALSTYFLSSSPTTNLDELKAELESRVRSGESYSTEGALFTFNPSTGKITTVYKPDSDVKLLLSLGSHYSVSDIFMLIDTASNITYVINNLQINSLSYIENKPVETALVLAYLVKDKHFSKLSRDSSSVSSGESSDYVFNFEDDGSLVLSKKDSEGKLVQIQSVSSVIKQQMANDSSAAANRTKVCESLFGAENESCNKHFYSILGRAGLNMLANIGEAVTNGSEIISKLNSAEVNIKYEILKNLDWKMKISNGNKAMVSVAEWVQRLKDDKRQNVKDLGNKYEEYLNKNVQVKQLLENMVNHINTNSRLLAEKYKEAVEQPAVSVKRRRRLTSEQVANLRSQVITENSLLNSPFPFPGRPGTFLYPINQAGGYQGNFTNNYKQSFSMIKQSLAGFKQKLSSATEKKLEEKIQKIEKLESELFDIHKKINTYTQILRSDKNSRFHRKDVRIEDIEDLINQYTESTKKQTRHIATVTTAFGKIKMLLESQDGETVQRENYYNL
jgi:hypothetical protein